MWAPKGWRRVRHRLEKSNFEVLAVDLASPTAPLADCRVLVVPGPSIAIDDAASARIVAFIQGGGNVFVLSAPVLGEDKRVQRSGLEPVAKLIGVDFGQDFILETDAALRLPRGAGEVFFATPEPHEVTRGLERERREDRLASVGQRRAKLANLGQFPGQSAARFERQSTLRARF